MSRKGVWYISGLSENVWKYCWWQGIVEITQEVQLYHFPEKATLFLWDELKLTKRKQTHQGKNITIWHQNIETLQSILRMNIMRCDRTSVLTITRPQRQPSRLEAATCTLGLETRFPRRIVPRHDSRYSPNLILAADSRGTFAVDLPS